MTNPIARALHSSSVPSLNSPRSRRPEFALRLVAAVCLAAVAGCASTPGDVATRYGDAATVYSTGVKVAPGTPLYFSAGLTAGENAPATMKGQALATLKNLAANITTAGYKPSDVVFVRAYLAPGPDGTVDYAGWNEAWSETFGNPAMPVKPARTTIAVPQLGRATTLIEIEYVAAGTSADAFAESGKLGLTVPNPMLKPYGTKTARIYNGMGVQGGSALYWTAGQPSVVADPKAAEKTPARYGDMKTQTKGVLTRLQENLAAVGLSYKDVIFLRAFVGPDVFNGNKYDLEGWNAGYDEFFNNPTNPHKPARTTVTTPTYGGTGVALEVEVLTAFPGTPPASVAFPATSTMQNGNLVAYGPAASPISSGIAMKGGSGLFFSAGAVPSVDGDVKTQALSTLAVLKDRLAAAGMGFKDVTFLRAYIVPGADGMIDFKGWSEAYATYFNNPGQTQKPARTTIAVKSLPRPNWKIEIDVIAAQP